MFSQELKSIISREISKILNNIPHVELPDGEIHFILHVDGAEDWSRANIRNESDRDLPVPDVLIRNLTVKQKDDSKNG